MKAYMKIKTLWLKSAKFFVLPALLAVSLLLGLFLMAPAASAQENVFELGGETSFAEGWNAAVAAADEDSHVRVNLSGDWSAENGSFGEGRGFQEGAIYVLEGADITIDLNGHVIDRGCSDEQSQKGSVIIVDGTLEVIDSNPYADHTIQGSGTGFEKIVRGGIIMGGDAEQGGGVYVGASGTLTFTDGSIYGNHATQQGGGVYVAEYGKMSLEGSHGDDLGISYNTAENGGGVYVAAGASVTLSGGFISYNTAN